MAPKKQRDDDRAKKTLYVTGFNPKLTKKHLLKELFSQGGPVKDITMFDTHAYVLFQHEESVPYCLALFNEVELFGDKLRLNPRYRSDETFSYMKYLAAVRAKMRDEYAQVKPPRLPPKNYSSDKHKDRSNRKSKDARKTRRDSDTLKVNFDKTIDKVANHASAHNETSRSDVSKASSRKRGKRGGKRGGKPRKIQKIVRHLL